MRAFETENRNLSLHETKPLMLIEGVASNDSVSNNQNTYFDTEFSNVDKTKLITDFYHSDRSILTPTTFKELEMISDIMSNVKINPVYIDHINLFNPLELVTAISEDKTKILKDLAESFSNFVTESKLEKIDTKYHINNNNQNWDIPKDTIEFTIRKNREKQVEDLKELEPLNLVLGDYIPEDQIEYKSKEEPAWNKEVRRKIVQEAYKQHFMEQIKIKFLYEYNIQENKPNSLAEIMSCAQQENLQFSELKFTGHHSLYLKNNNKVTLVFNKIPLSQQFFCARFKVESFFK